MSADRSGSRCARLAAAWLCTALFAATLGTVAAPPVAAQSAPSAPAAAAQDLPAAHAERFKKLAEELRCLVCQNQSLADSNADLAVDLRREVETMMTQGKSDAEIKDFLVVRYGDFVLYRPPVKSSTAMLWFGPFLLLLIGAIAWVVVQRRSRARPAAAAGADGPAEPDRERARRLLGD